MEKKLMMLFVCLFFTISFVAAQTQRITGVVLSEEDGQPIIGASVLVDGTTIGASTDIDGKFVLPNVPKTAKTLNVSYIGMTSVSVSLSRGVMKIYLKPNAKALDEVVVTAQGITRKQKSLGYATQQVSSEDLERVRQTDLNNALVGKVSGIKFLGGSGAKFDAGRIVLRGTTSLSNAGGNEPIYVIDGIIANANSINMDDVKSINVLKGPAATALYGSRGANGAVIIISKALNTTDAVRTEVNLSHSILWEKAYIHSDMQKEYGGGYYGADAAMDVFKYDSAKHPSYLQKMDGVRYYDYADDASWGPRFDGRLYAPWSAWDPTHPKFGELDTWEAKSNLNDLFRTGLTNTTNLSFSRSGKDYSIGVSFTNSNRTGVAPNSDAVRRFLSVKTMFKPMDKMTVAFDYKYTYRKNHNSAAEGYGGRGNVLYSYIQWGHQNININDLKDYKRPDGTFRSWNITSPTDLTPQFHNNPFAMYNEINSRDVYQWNLFNVDVSYDIIGNLKAGVKVNGNLRTNFNDVKVPMNLLGEVSEYTQGQNTLSDVSVQGRLTWGQHFLQDKLSVDAAAFMESRRYHYEENKVFTRDGLFLNNFFNTAASMGLPGGSNSTSEILEKSIYGTATAGWNDTYYLDLSLRNDWSSTLNPDKNGYLYGGVSFAAIASNWVNKKWLNFWKIRASMAQVGSSMDPYNIYKSYVSNADTRYGTLSGMRNERQLKDVNIKPTISTSYEIGTEFKLFDERLWGDFNFYNRDSKDQIINVNTTPASGYTTRKMNAGLIRNRGVELLLGGTPIKTKNWSWDVTANVSRNTNTLVELVDGQDSYQIYWMSWSTRIYSYAEVGKPIGVIRGSSYKRDANGNLILQKRAQPNDDGEYTIALDTKAQKELGNVQPDFTGGFSTALTYKNFRLGASFDFQIGGDLVSATNMFGEGSGLLKGTVGTNERGGEIRGALSNNGGVLVNGVTADGKPVSTYMSAYYYFSRKSLVFEDYVYDASYLKLRELSLSYDIPRSFLKKTKCGINKASISLIAQNPWLIYSGVPNIDPSESGSATNNFIEGGQAVSTRSFGCTVNITF